MLRTAHQRVINGINSLQGVKMINNLLNNFADNFRGERENKKIKGLSIYMVGGRILCKVNKILKNSTRGKIEEDFKPFLYNILGNLCEDGEIPQDFNPFIYNSMQGSALMKNIKKLWSHKGKSVIK